jgi:hypothetical protein
MCCIPYLPEPSKPGYLASQVKLNLGQVLSFRIACQVNLNLGQVPFFRIRFDPTKGITIYCRVRNLWMKQEDVLPGIIVNEIAIIPVPLNMDQSNTVKDFPLLEAISVGKVHCVLQ